MDPLLNRAAFLRLYLLSSALFLNCYCFYIDPSDTIATFTPSFVDHHIYEESPTGVYISWNPPVNIKIFHKSSDPSRNVANSKNNANASLNKLSVPLHHPIGSNSDPHPQYNIMNGGSHEPTNTSQVGANLYDMNSTKNLTRIGDNQGKMPDMEEMVFDVNGFVNSYTVFYKRQDDSEVKFITVDSTQYWVYLDNITAGIPYDYNIRVTYSSQREFNSTMYSFTLTTNFSLCRCNHIGTEGDQATCNLTNGSQPCFCKSGFGGLFCDQCLPKHYPKLQTCTPCPCDSRFGTFNCRLVNNEPVCNCHIGYSGESCDKCSNGYFSYYQVCAKCICNKNVDPNSPEICDPDIGACKHCLYNTSGFACQECLPGFTGDPILHKNCTKREPRKPKSPTIQQKASFPMSLKVGLPLVILFICIIIAILVLQRHRFYRRLQPFWTIELKDDHDSVNLNANDGQEFGASSNGHDDMDFYAKHASQRGGMQYSTLRETM